MSGRPGALLSAMLSAGVAEISDPLRFRRGRLYRRDGAVLGIDVQPGRLHGEVQGSRPTPYRVEVAVAPAAQGATGAALVPDPKRLRIECSCPDWDEPCKHAVAVLLELAERVGDDPDLLTTWRSGSADGWPVAGAAPAAGTATRDTATRDTAPRDTPTLMAGTSAGTVAGDPGASGDAPPDPFFVGGAALRESPAPLALFPAVGRGRLMVGDVDLGVIIDDATATAAAGRE